MKNTLLQIVKLRRIRKLTQQDMADELGISQRTYSRIESGDKKLNIDTLGTIAQILQVSLIELLVEDEKILDSKKLDENERQLFRKILNKQNEEISFLRKLISEK